MLARWAGGAPASADGGVEAGAGFAARVPTGQDGRRPRGGGGVSS